VKRVGRVLTYRKAAVASLLFPPAGIPALLYSIRASRLAAQGEVESARIEGEKARDWSWYAVGYGLTVYLIAFMTWLLFTNGGSVRIVFLAWSILTDGDGWRSLLKGFWINVQVFLIAEVIVLAWALVVAVVRLLPGKACRPIRFLATAYVDAFRAFPAILVVYLVGLGFAQANVPVLGSLSDMQYAILGLSLTYGAYVSEVYRAGIDSVHPSQGMAARSLGLSHFQTLRHVIVPQAVRRVIPPLLNDFIGLQKDTVLVSYIGVVEIFRNAQIIQQANFNFTPLLGVGLVFIVVTIPLARLTDWLIAHDKGPRDVRGRRTDAGGAR